MGAALTGCAKALPQSPLDPQGPVARWQTGLLMTTLWFALGIGIVVSAVLIYVVLRFREKPGDKSIPAQIHGSTKLEILWTIIPIVILAFVAVPTVQVAWKQSAQAEEAQTPDAMVVRAIGHQWWFEFEYPDAKVYSAGELVIPVGKPIVVKLTSDDVIHSFWVPKLAGKMDVIPGRENEMWLKAETPDIYFGQCAEYCGTSHAKMRFRVRAVTQAEFDKYIKDRQAGVKAAVDEKAARGKAIVEDKKNCAACHAIDSTVRKANNVSAPNLGDIGSRTTIAAGVLDKTDETLKQWIRNPQSVKPGVTMRPFPASVLSDEDLDAVVHYLNTLK